jgi:hypothetical protein
MSRVCPKCRSNALEIKSSCWFSYDGEWVGEALEIPDTPRPSTPIHCMNCDWYGEDNELLEVDRIEDDCPSK